MRELLKKLYSIAGKESQKLSRMIVFEIVKSILKVFLLGRYYSSCLKFLRNYLSKKK